MNQKELSEIRRRFRPEHNNIQHIYGCYVNTNREIISQFDESMGLLSETESEKYLTLLKKALSGAPGVGRLGPVARRQRPPPRSPPRQKVCIEKRPRSGAADATHKKKRRQESSLRRP